MIISENQIKVDECKQNWKQYSILLDYSYYVWGKEAFAVVLEISLEAQKVIIWS